MSLADLEAMRDQGVLMGMPIGAGLNSVGMANNQRRNRRDGTPVLPMSRPRRQAQPFVQFAEPMMDPNLAFQLAAKQHFGAQNRMISNTNAAIAKEMDRRVSIARDIREMAHAKDMERMRQQYALRRIREENKATRRRRTRDEFHLYAHDTRASGD